MTATRGKRSGRRKAAKRTASVAGGRLRQRRKELGLSLEQLAQKTGLTASFLSLIERDQNDPSLDSLRRIAEALEVPIFYFTQQANGQNPVVRRDERVKITFPPGHVTCELLVPNLRGRLEVFIGRAHPSAGNFARTPKHDSDECLYLMAGSLQVVLADGEHTLRSGDSIYFHGSTLRELKALGRREAVYISMITPPVL
jgi:transcriptional regulator with XRE-family HTH domain